jgi:hypothetical protein
VLEQLSGQTPVFSKGACHSTTLFFFSWSAFVLVVDLFFTVF